MFVSLTIVSQPESLISLFPPVLLMFIATIYLCLEISLGNFFMIYNDSSLTIELFEQEVLKVCLHKRHLRSLMKS